MSSMVIRRPKKVLATFCATALATVAIAVPAGAANQEQDGLVNVAIGDITVKDVNVGVAAGIAANVCGVQVGPVVLLAQEVDATSQQRTVCRSDADVVLSQN
jgi:hypothetical protein